MAGRPTGNVRCDVSHTVFKPTEMPYYSSGKSDYDVLAKFIEAPYNY